MNPTLLTTLTLLLGSPPGWLTRGTHGCVSRSLLDQATRKLIRSHVMRGKKHKRRGVSGFAPTNLVQRPQVKLQEAVDMYTSLQPGRIGTELYFVDFPREIEPSVILNMAQVSAVAMRIIFPLLMEIGFHPDDNAWLYPTGRDASSLHVNAFAIQSFIDRVLRRQLEDIVNPVATLHHQKGLKLLRERLHGDDDDAKISDDTISAVLKLASAAQFDGEVETARKHMQGLRKMTELRGGLDVFQYNPKLLVEIWSFSHSMLSQEEMKPVQDLDGDLAEAWFITRKFCLLTNLGTQTKMLMRPATIYGTMTAVMYRLLHMGFAAGSLDETLRLGLLAFTHHIFLQWQDMRLPCHHQFRHIYRNHLQVHPLEDTVPPQLLMWLLMIGAVSVFGISEEPWLGDYLQRHFERCRVNTWKDLQAILKSFMWIPLLDGKHGEEVYNSLVQLTEALYDFQDLVQKAIEMVGEEKSQISKPPKASIRQLS
ncbi:hypothetical protein F5B20DRAFT_573754 [Whalleya microplaca]|nr:hypothetical protein F5B20DRAFT_573754 [Whalleya microplaca]